MQWSYVKRLLMASSLGGLAIAAFASVAKAEYSVLLSSGESQTYEGYFFANEDVYASCDSDCTDLDIYLYDAYTGELVTSDTLTDANPIVTAPYEGDFLVETYMVSCSTSVCAAWTDSDHGF
ncbi:MAG: hypothetical protein AAF921_28345 [Cyanobacteria bacterium P01_D01_bin.44]